MAYFAQAQKKDLPALTALWQTCFGDEAMQINAFWRALWQDIRVFAAYEGKTPVAMLCALPTALVNEAGESFPAAYLYAVCTAPQQRNRGLCGALLAYAENALQKEGCSFAALVPSSKGLFGFYQKFGYQTAFFHKEYTVSAKKGTAKITKLDADGYQNLRENAALRSVFVLSPAAAAMAGKRRRGTFPHRDRGVHLLLCRRACGRAPAVQGTAARLSRSRRISCREAPLQRGSRAHGGRSDTLRDG